MNWGKITIEYMYKIVEYNYEIYKFLIQNYTSIMARFY